MRQTWNAGRVRTRSFAAPQSARTVRCITRATRSDSMLGLSRSSDRTRWNALGRLSLAVFGLVTLVSCATMFDFGTLPSSFPSGESSRESSSARNSPSGTQIAVRPDTASYQAGRIDYSHYRLRGVEPRVQYIPSEIDRSRDSGALPHSAGELPNLPPDPP